MTQSAVKAQRATKRERDPCPETRPARGLHFERYYTTPGVDPVRHRRVGAARRRDHQRAGGEGLRAARTSRCPSPGRRPRPTWWSASTSAASSARPSASAASASSSAASPTPSPAGGATGGYFATEEDAQTFHAELKHILLYQHACFNSPVWFNVGIEEKPQCSACFINSVEDTMDSILTLAKTEGMLFKYGSGTGSNLSKLRSSTRAAGRRRHRLRPGLLHEGLRRLRRRHQERRQDPPRGQDGHPRHRPSGHRRLHQVQGGRGAQGLGADRRRLRRGLQRPRRRLRLDRLPERQPLGARHRRLHEGRPRRRRVARPGRASAASRWAPTRPAT